VGGVRQDPIPKVARRRLSKPSLLVPTRGRHKRERPVNDRPTSGYRVRWTIRRWQASHQTGPSNLEPPGWCWPPTVRPSSCGTCPLPPHGFACSPIRESSTTCWPPIVRGLRSSPSPPAGPLEVELVARERRRRQSLRTIHLSAEVDRAARIAALRDGYDEALPQTIDAGELAARANLLEERSRVRSATCLAIAEGSRLGTRSGGSRSAALAIASTPR
jgi:hypothetical protein